MSQNSPDGNPAVVCHLCDSSNVKVLRDMIRYETKRDVCACETCGLVFLRPVQIKQKRASDFYTEGKFRNLPRTKLGLMEHSRADEIFEGRIGQATRRLSRMLPYLRPEMSLLEVGCSAGSFISVAKSHFCKCTAIELDSGFAKYTRERQDVEVLETPIEDLSESDGPYDVICMWHVLEHLADPVEVLRKLAGKLNADGILFVEVPNVYDPLLTVWKNKTFEKFYYQEPHLYYFAPDTLRAVFEKAGLVVDVSPVQIYSLINNLRWALFGQPQKNQPANKWDHINILDKLYRRWLVGSGKTDTLFAIAKLSHASQESV